MKLYEEMKIWESLWDDSARTYTDEDTEHLIDQCLEKTKNNYVFEYNGFTEDFYQDEWDSYAQEHTQSYQTGYYKDFEYEVDVVDMFDDLVNLDIKRFKQLITKKKISLPQTKLVTTYKNLKNEQESVSKEASTAYWNKLSLFVAENLDALVDDLYKALHLWYESEAYEWAIDNLEPEWDDEPEWD